MAATNLSRTIVTAALALGVAAALPAAAAADQPPTITTVTASKVVHGPTGSIGSATAHCPRGTRVISGGYASTFRAGALLPFASMRSGPRTWRVSAYRVGGGGGNLRLTTYAKCGDHLGPLTRVIAKTSVPSPSGHVALRTLRPRCPGDDFALSGGFKVTVNGRSNPNSPPVAVIFGSRAAGHAWAVTAVRLASGESQLTAFAYCAAERPFKRGISGVLPGHQAHPATATDGALPTRDERRQRRLPRPLPDGRSPRRDDPGHLAPGRRAPLDLDRSTTERQ